MKKKPDLSRTPRSKSKLSGTLVSSAESRQAGHPLCLLSSAFGALGVFAISFLVYFQTLYPTIAPGDSADFVISAYRLGVAHPPGYPLYLMLAKIFTFLPLGSIAWRVNLLSGVLDSLAASCLCLIVVKWTQEIWIGVVSGLLFGFSPLVWQYAVSAEVFALNNLIAVLLLYLTLQFEQTREVRYAYWGALFCGLGLAHHHTIFFFILPICVYLLSRRGLRSILLIGWARLFCCFLLGLSPYLYLPLASIALPFPTWGASHTWDGFFDHILRRDYGSLQLSAGEVSDGSFLDGLRYYFINLSKQILFLGPAVAIYGVFCENKKDKTKEFLRLTLGIYGFTVLVFHLLANVDAHLYLQHEILARFWQLPNLLVFIWFGLFLSNLPRKIGMSVGVSCVLMQLAFHFQSHDQHKNTSSLDYAKAVLMPLKKNALYLSLGDLNSYLSFYAQECEGIRNDVKVLDRQLLGYAWARGPILKKYPDLSIPGKRMYFKDGYSLKELIDANKNQFPIYINKLTEQGKVKDVEQSFHLVPLGFVDEVLPKDQIEDPLGVERQSRLAISYLHPELIRQSYHQAWERVMFTQYSQVLFDQGAYFVLWALHHEGDPNALKTGINFMEMYVKESPNIDRRIYKNLGIGYMNLIKFQPQASLQATRYFKEFLSLTSPSDPEYASALRDLKSLGGAL